MKKLIALLLVFTLALSLAACGKKAAEPEIDFAKVIAQSRDAEFNKYYDIFAVNTDGSFTATEGYSADYDEAYTNDMASMLLELLGLEASQVDKMAMSISMMMTQSYGIVIAKPAKGSEDAVKESLNNFVQSQIAAQEHYLPDQYEIAKSAQVYQTAGGVYVMVMSENGQAVLDNILGIVGK